MREVRIGDVRIGEYLAADVMRCVGKKGFIYLNKFEKLHGRGYSFNWCAGLFTALWFAYRKMWKAAGAAMGFNVLYSVILTSIQNRIMTQDNAAGFMWAAVILFIVSLAFFGFLGDWLYCRYVTAVLDEQGCRGRQAVENAGLNAALEKAGGTSRKGLAFFWIAGVAGQWLVSWLISFL